jgi:hypothetical protein
MKWIEPWHAITGDGLNIVAELKKEIHQKHALYGRDFIAIARRADCDDVLFEVNNGSFAVVHLTFTGKQEKDPEFPFTTIYKTMEEFVRNAMIPDAEEYGNSA